MKTEMRAVFTAFGLVSSLFALPAVATPLLVAQYDFNNNLNSSVGGAPALVATDPTNVASFSTDTVNGNSQTVYNFGGAAVPTDQQGGLTFTNGLISSGAGYSIDLTFKLNEGNNAWRRIVDVQGRQSDNGFYVDPSNLLDIFPITAGGNAFTTGEYHNVLLTISNGIASAFLDGVQSFAIPTNVMDLAIGDSVNLFLDNVIGGGQGEWSSGSIASARFFSLTPNSVPEPGTWALTIVGFAALCRLRSQITKIS